MKNPALKRTARWSASQLEQRVMLAADAGAAFAATSSAAIATTTVEVGPEICPTTPDANASAATLVFVDGGVEHADVLLAGVSPDAEVLLLDANRDAIDQISESLATHRNVASVHIVSHGANGTLQFASGEVAKGDLDRYASQLQRWSRSLTGDADILLYACEAAEGKGGKQLIQRMAELTGADVAASTNVTGNSSKGGDWELELTTGTIESALAFDAASLAKYEGVLIVFNGSDYFLTGGASSWEDAQAQAVAAGGNLVSINDAAEEAWLQSTFGTSERYWIGINDAASEGNFVWASGDPVTYTNWAPFEPNDWEGNQDYGLMNFGAANQWDDDGTDSQFVGIIEVPEGGGNNGSTVEVRARGDEGGEQFRLQIDGATVATFTTTTSDQTFSYVAAGNVTADQVRVEFFGDQWDPANGIDTNLIVDFIRIDGTTFETEAPSTFSTGTWSDPDGTAPGFKQSETLHANGYFQFDGGGSNSGTEIQVRARGDEGGEQLRILVDGAPVSLFTATTAFQTFSHTADSTVTADQVRVEFINDVWDPANGIDSNLVVDFIRLDGVTYQTEAPTTLSTGTWSDPDGTTPGFKQSEILHANGYFQYLADQPSQFGEISLATSVYNVGESEGSVDVTILRQNGSDGTVTVEYNSINSSAVAGQDYTAVSGTAVFAPGQVSQTITIPITNDSSVEGDEQFSFAIDAVTGGATLLVPRTATITIDDDDSISASGDGLLGEYFDNIDFTNRYPTRVDSTVDFNWGTTAPLSGMGSDTFSVRWTGQIEPLYSETYTFRTWSDDGIRLWVDDQLIINEWNDHAPTFHTGTIALNAGQLYDIRLEHYENTGGAVAQLSWSSASQTLEVIPQSQLYAAEPTDPPGGNDLTSQTLYTGLVQPTSIDFSPDGQNTYITEQRGIVKVARNGVVSNFIDIRDIVNGTRDRGLLDLAVHPDFENNPYIYLLFTYDPPEVFQNQSNSLAGPDRNGNRAGRLIRVTADAATNYTTAVAGSEVVIVGSNSTWDNFNAFTNSTTNFNEPPAGINADGSNVQDFIATDSESHTVGAVEFGPDGALYVSIGDGTSYNRVDDRTVRVQDIDNLSGKVLRVDPITGEGLSDNPFYNGNPDANRSKVYQLGLRNPFRMTIDQATGQVYVGDVGWTQWEEINAAGPGANFGWPFYEGGSGNSLQTNGYRDLPEAAAFYSDITVTPAIYALNHGATGINAIVLGDIYTGSTYPSEYQGDLFFNDLGQGIVRNVSFDASGNITNVETFTTGAQIVVQIVQGPDGNLYYVDLNDGTVGRWVFN